MAETNQRQARTRRPYRTHDEAVDASIESLLTTAGIEHDADLIQEMVTSCLRLARNNADRGELKLVNAALKEFAYAFKVFKGYRSFRKVSIFGSARSQPHDPDYEQARRLGLAMAEENWMVITGAGPGIMAAGHEGAGAEKSFGAAIRLPMENEPNTFIEGDPKLINFKYFFTRKVTFLKESHAFVLLPGGFGTLDEAFELLTLLQTGKSDLHPIVLLEAPDGTYWKDWMRFVEVQLAGRGLISPEDMHLIYATNDVANAVREITGFYANYQSQRYVNGRLVFRLLRIPPQHDLAELRREFDDILKGAGLEPVDPSEEEIAENDAIECRRLAVDFDRTSFGRLRQLINALNRY